MKKPSFSEAARVFIRIGLLSFGGPAAQIAVMHRELVDENSWLSEAQFLSALSFCMLLPGPEAMQLTTYAGWRLHGVAGGLFAGLAFVLPGALVMMALATGYALWGTLPLVSTLFLGIKAAVVIVVIQALMKLAAKALKTKADRVLALLAFLGLFALALPFPLVIAAAAAWGAFTARGTAGESHTVRATPLRTITIWGGLWAAPLLAAWAAGADRLLEIGLFFSRLAVITFGGAYAVLAWMAQDVVTNRGWLTPQAMVDGLGLAETTPGPLILVTEFVGFQAATGGGISAGVLAALMTLWVTFTPCFLWIFLGAPYIEMLSSKPRLHGAMRAISAAVTGVILNLSVWFALNVMFGELSLWSPGPVKLLIPVWSSVSLIALSLTALAALLLLRLRLGLIPVLFISAGSGWLLSLV
ncbi:chromate efflux transporter [Candidatus Halocynthiibacter alkanivorans]|uniref:chromate efflux transporter n=1 Tax=Candidatus Halocynthiibacter alkanivorans TaxID=2267619 RepID=UPI000DF1BE2E|nr:chromate efflux transporter [Candidatus Halocynthiibacter alkanivorans]